MKKIAAFIFAALIAAGVFGATETVDGVTYTYSISNGEATIGTDRLASAAISTTTKGDIVIPSMLGGCPVTAIGSSAFCNCKSLTSITIPDSVRYIGSFTFDNCTSLSSVNIPDNVTEIGLYAFYNCSSLSSVIMPDKVTKISERAFYNCTSLSSVTIPSNVTEIGLYAFYNCSLLSSVTIPNNVTEIGSCAFSNCRLLSEVVFPPDSEIMMAGDTFNNTPFYDDLPDGIVVIGKTFLGVKGDMPSVVSIPTGVTLIGSHALYNNDIVISVEIPQGVKEIGAAAFYGCGHLTDITIPDTITRIGGSAFAYTRISSMNIPEGVAAIAYRAFYNCSWLSSIILPPGITKIADEAFSGCNKLSTITIPDSVESIGNQAFYYCSSLARINIPPKCVEIGTGVFASCDSLYEISISQDNPVYDSRNGCNSIIESATNKLISGCNGSTIPESVVALAAEAFMGVNQLREVAISAKTTSVGRRAFAACENLSRITVAEGNPVYDSREDCNAIIETASNKLIEGCRNSVVPSSVKTIGEYAFYHKPLSVVELPEGLISIEERAFSGTNLKTIDFPKSLKSIGDLAFSGSELRRVVLPNTITAIDGIPFYYCKKLHSVKLSSAVKAICGGMFWECEELTNVTIPEGVVSFGNEGNMGVFDGCSSLCSLTFPSSVKEMTPKTFYSSGVRSIIFNGNAPTAEEFKNVKSDCVAYVKEASTGWNVDIPGTWKGIAIEYMPTCPPASWSRSFMGSQIWKGGLTSGAKDNDFKKVSLPRVGVENNGGFVVGASGYSRGPYYDKYAFAPEEDWSVALLAKTSSAPNGALWSFGGSGKDGHGIALVQKSKTEVAVVHWVRGGNNTEIVSATVPKGFHTYVVTYASESRTFSLYVDNESPVTSTIESPIYLDDIGYQFGAVHGGGALAVATNAIIDDAAWWTGMTLSAAQVKEVVAAVGELLPTGDVSSEEVDGLVWTFINDSGVITISSGVESAAISTEASGDIVIPSTLGGNAVSVIGENAFADCNLITSISIPSSVTIIDEDAFLGCDALTTVYVEPGDIYRIKTLMANSGVDVDALTFVESNPEVAMLCYLPLNGTATVQGTIDTAKVVADSNVSFVTDHKFGSGAYKANVGSIVIADEENGLADFDGGWAISLWFHGNGMADWKDIFGFKIGNYVYKLESCSGAAFQIYNLSDTPNASGSWTTNGGLNSQIAASRNAWHHLLIQANTPKTGFDIYLDGEYNQSYSKASGALWGGDNYLAALTKVVIGTKGIHNYNNTSHSGNDGRSSTALVDDLAIYNGRLSMNQIRELASNVPRSFDGTEIITLPNATYSHDFNGGMTTPSSTLGGAIIPNRGDTFGSFTHVIREGEPNGAGAIPSTASGKNGQYGSTELVDDEADWTIAMVAKAANVANGTFWSIGASCNLSGQTGLALVLTDATHVSLVRWQKGGSGNETLLTAEVVDATEAFHLYTVAYNHATEVYTLFVDATEAASFTGARTFTTNGYQIGAVHGGAASVGLAVANGFVLDDFAVWKDFAAEEAHVKKIVAKYTPVIAVGSYAFDWPEGETTWRNDIGFTVGSATGITPCAGDTIRFATGETITFASGAVIPSGLELIIDLGTVKLASGTPSKVTVSAGAMLDVAGTPDREFAIVLNGGTLTNSGSNIGVSKKQTSAIELTADSLIDSEHDFGSVGGSWGRITCKLNGHTLTKRGAGTFVFANTSFSGGGTINVEKGVIELDKGYVFPSGTTLNITGSSEGLFSVAQTGTQSGTVNLLGNPTVRLKITSIPNFVKNATGWTGKLLIAANISGLTSFGANTSLYGNASEIEIASGASCSGYFPKSARTSKLTINGTFTVNDGYSGENQAATVSELAGSGTIVDGIAANSKSATPIVKVEKYADWNGTIQEATTKKLTIEFLKPTLPGVEGDDDVEVTGDAETGFVVKPSEGMTEVVITIPEGVASEKVTIEVSTAVQSVKANGATIKVVKGAADITAFLDIPAAVDGVVNLGAAEVKEAIVKETMDTEKGAVIELSAENPTLTTTATKPGLTYTLFEGSSLDSMGAGASKLGDGTAWTPEIKVKGGASAFYSIKVAK